MLNDGRNPSSSTPNNPSLTNKNGGEKATKDANAEDEYPYLDDSVAEPRSIVAGYA